MRYRERGLSALLRIHRLAEKPGRPLTVESAHYRSHRLEICAYMARAQAFAPAVAVFDLTLVFDHTLLDGSHGTGRSLAPGP